MEELNSRGEIKNMRSKSKFIGFKLKFFAIIDLTLTTITDKRKDIVMGEEHNEDEILGYECMTPNCGARSSVLLNCCPLCWKKDWRAVVTRNAREIKKKPKVDELLDDGGGIKEEYLPFESEVSITMPDISKRKFEIKYSRNSYQNDKTGAVERVRVIDKVNDRYIEKVVYTDTGTIIRDCDEKLTDHFGHGNAKKTVKVNE